MAGGCRVGHPFLISRALLELQPRWEHRDARRTGKIDIGVSFDCPHCHAIANPREHRLEIWFVATLSADDMTVGGDTPKLFDHAGTRFEELTVWTEKPERDPLLRLSHWAGYIEAGRVYDLPRVGGAP